MTSQNKMYLQGYTIIVRFDLNTLRQKHIYMYNILLLITVIVDILFQMWYMTDYH